jgi:hypothetical protein
VRRVFKQIQEWALRGRDIEQVVVDVSERFAPFRRKEPIPMFDRRRDEGAPRKFCERLRCGYRQLAAALEYGAGRLVAMRTRFLTCCKYFRGQRGRLVAELHEIHPQFPFQ